MDIVSRIGGYMASFLPVIQISSPLFLLYYLYKLSEILLIRSVNAYFDLAKTYNEEVKRALIIMINTGKIDEQLVSHIKVRIDDIDEVLSIENP
jgi:hypothetical protein